MIEYASLVEYGKGVAPEKVLWVYYEDNDLLGDLQREKKHPLLMQYMQDRFSQNLINRQREIDGRLEEYLEREREREREKEKEKERKKERKKEREREREITIV